DALISRAAELDPDFESGAIDTFLITYEGARASFSKDAESRARAHLLRAIERSEGRSAAPFVAAAESLAVPAEDRGEFETLLNSALGIDVDAKPEWRLANIIAQRRAAWLLDHADDFFLTTTPDEESEEEKR
ncbi:MAG TPA: TRAP transporter TatT component family protein, partial [Thermoanaerobaculia bacterium]